MKTKDIAKQHNLALERFNKFIVTSGYKYKTRFSELEINESDVDAIVAEFSRQELERLNPEQAEARAAVEQAAAEKQVALSKILITSGFNFDGYTITRYSGYISGDDAISVERGLAVFGMGKNIKDELMASLVEIRRNALAELKEAAYALGCNAVIGVDFDYLTLDPQTANLHGGTTYLPYIFGVTANGNAVVIEKNRP